jgi:hypothetical protein
MSIPMGFFYGPLWLTILIVTINLILVFLLESEKYAYPAAQGEDPYYDQEFSTQQFSEPRNSSRTSFSGSFQ